MDNALFIIGTPAVDAIDNSDADTVSLDSSSMPDLVGDSDLDEVDDDVSVASTAQNHPPFAHTLLGFNVNYGDYIGIVGCFPGFIPQSMTDFAVFFAAVRLEDFRCNRLSCLQATNNVVFPEVNQLIYKWLKNAYQKSFAPYMAKLFNIAFDLEAKLAAHGCTWPRFSDIVALTIVPIVKEELNISEACFNADISRCACFSDDRCLVTKLWLCHRCRSWFGPEDIVLDATGYDFEPYVCKLCFRWLWNLKFPNTSPFVIISFTLSHMS